MPFKPRKDPVPPLDPRFERFRGALAEAFLEKEKVGYLSLNLEPYFTITGPWWRRRWADPVWCVDWLMIFLPEIEDRRTTAGDAPYEDGIEVGDPSAFDELLADSFQIRDHLYSLRWVDRSVHPQVWEVNYGLDRAKQGHAPEGQ